MSFILISYLTKSGSTKEVAEKVGQILADSGHKVDLQALDRIYDVSKYDGVVIGAPINGMQWLPDALSFVDTHKTELLEKKVAYFTLAMLAYQGRSFWQKKIYKALEKPANIVAPIHTAVFGGVAVGELPAPMRLILGIPKTAESDQRDWKMIEAWAEELASKM